MADNVTGHTASLGKITQAESIVRIANRMRRIKESCAKNRARQDEHERFRRKADELQAAVEENTAALMLLKEALEAE